MNTDDGEAATFAAVFSVAVARRGVSLSYLSRRLSDLATPVTVATLSYWRSGRSEPERKASLDAVDSLEGILGLRNRALRDTIRRPHRPQPLPRAAPVHDIVHPPEAALRAFRALDFQSPQDEFVEQRVIGRHEIDERGHTAKLHITNEWRAIIDGAQRAGFVLTFDEPDEPKPDARGLLGVQIGRQYYAPAERTYALEILFPEPVPRDTRVFGEYEICFTSAAGDMWGYYAFRAVVDLVQVVQFTSPRFPSSVRAFAAPAGGEEQTWDLPMVQGSVVHQSFRSFGPGHAGLRWVW